MPKQDGAVISNCGPLVLQVGTKSSRFVDAGRFPYLPGPGPCRGSGPPAKAPLS